MDSLPSLPFRMRRTRFRSDAARPRVSVIVPTMNESPNLPHVLPLLPRYVDEVIIVDGASTDDTVAVAHALLPDAHIIRQTGRGKGNALACGFAYATGDILVMLDADGSTDPREIPLFVDALQQGADFVKGSREMPGGGSADLTRVRRYGNRGLAAIVNLLFGVKYTDLCYGYAAFWRHCLPSLAIDCQGFEVETLLAVRAARAGLRTVEVPSVEHLRIHGQSNLKPVRDGLAVLRIILRERMGRRHRVLAGGPAWAMLAGEIDDAFAAPEEAAAALAVRT